MSLVPVPEWTEQQTADYFDIAVRDAFRVGLTSVHDAMSTPHHIDFFKRCVVPEHRNYVEGCSSLMRFVQDGRRAEIACKPIPSRLVPSSLSRPQLNLDQTLPHEPRRL